MYGAAQHYKLQSRHKTIWTGKTLQVFLIISILSGSPAKSGPMTLTSENRFPLFFVC